MILTVFDKVFDRVIFLLYMGIITIHTGIKRNDEVDIFFGLAYLFFGLATSIEVIQLL